MLWLGRSATFDRSVHLIAVQDIPSVSAPGDGGQECFACFVALDDVRVPTERVYDFADRLLQSGCAYVCFWGPDCERWHDITDERAARDSSGSSPKTVMTTWHSGEAIADALFYFFTCTVPDNDFGACPSALIICPSALAAEVSTVSREWLHPAIRHETRVS